MIRGLFQSLDIDQAKTAVEGNIAHAAFLKNIADDPERERIHQAARAPVVVHQEGGKEGRIMDGIARAGAGAPLGVVALDIWKSRLVQNFLTTASIQQQAIRAVPGHVTIAFGVERVKGGVGMHGEKINRQVAFGAFSEEFSAPGRLAYGITEPMRGGPADTELLIHPLDGAGRVFV